VEQYTTWFEQAQESYGKCGGKERQTRNRRRRRGESVRQKTVADTPNKTWIGNWPGAQLAPDCGSATQNEPAFQRLKTFCLQPMSRRGSFWKAVGDVAA